MKVILEGPDGAGKSTAMGELVAGAAKAGEKVKTWHHGPYSGQSGGRLYNHYAQSIDFGVYMDRAWPSEMIYSPTVREERCRLSKAQIGQLDNLALAAGYVMVLCLPPLDTVGSNWAERYENDGEYVTSAEDMEEVYDMYTSFMDNTGAWTNLPVLHYDYTQDHAANLRARCIQAAPRCGGASCAG